MKQRLIKMLTPSLPDDIGQIHVSWDFPEFVRRPRTRAWYIAFSVVLGLMLLYALFTQNYLFAIILGLGSFIIIFQYFQDSRDLPVVIGEDGMIVDKNFYTYKAIKNFAIIYEPPEVKYLYLEFNSSTSGTLSIPLNDVNPIKVREALLNYVDEDLEKDDEHFHDIFERMLRLR
jgi:hypothetical protein